MQHATENQQKLPVSWYMLVVTLVGAIVILIPLYLFYNAGYVSANLTIGITIVVFIAAATYESYLFYLITRAMLDRVDRD